MSAQPEQAHSAKLDLGQGRSKPNGRGTLLRRGLALSVSTALAAVVLTSVLPPLVADQSDRAVVNAPVTLLTAPIAGEVKSLDANPGDRIAAKAQIAEVINNRIDRTTLIALESKKTDSVQNLQAIRSRQDSDGHYVLALAMEISQQKATVVTRYAQQIVDLTAQVGSAAASMAEKQQILSHQDEMVKRGVAAPEMMKAATQQLSAARFQKESAESKLAQKQAQLDSTRRDIFVGDDLHELAALVQKKRDMELEVQRLQIEAVQVSAALVDNTRLFNAERDRLATLEHSAVTASGQGEILNASATVGRHVSAGDTLARMVDCDSSFVVAIFSYRQGIDLSVGTRVSIDAGSAGRREGTVTAVLPKTSDKVDETYAVPFPQTERRELYVLVRPDTPLRTLATDGGQDQCGIGQWVTVTRTNGWVPSTSVLWRQTGRLISAAAARLIPRAWAEALAHEDQAVSRASPRWSAVRDPAAAGRGHS